MHIYKCGTVFHIRSAGDALRSLFYKLTHQYSLAINGVTVPFDFYMGDKGIWYEEIWEKLFSIRHGIQAQYLADHVRRGDKCWVVHNGQSGVDVLLLLTLLHRKGVCAQFFEVAVEPGHGTAAEALDLPAARKAMPGHLFHRAGAQEIFDICRRVEIGDIGFDAVFFFADLPIGYETLISAKSFETLFVRSTPRRQRTMRDQGFLGSAISGGYFVDARISNEHQLLLRKRHGGNWY